MSKGSTVPSWRVTATDKIGEAIEHSLVMRLFLASMSENMSEEMTQWITEAGLVAYLKKQLAASVYDNADAIQAYLDDGLLLQGLTELVTHGVKHVEKELLRFVRQFCERSGLRSPWEWVIVDHLCFHALLVVLGPRLGRGLIRYQANSQFERKPKLAFIDHFCAGRVDTSLIHTGSATSCG